MDCPDACSLVITRDGSGSARIRGNPEHPFTAGFTCAKIKRLIDRLNHPDRIVSPMVRSEDRWQAIGWDDALDLCAEKISHWRSEPASILHFHGEGAKGVLKQANKLFFAQLGASRTKGSLCDAAGFIACLADFGSRHNNDIEDLHNADRIVNWGKDLPRSSIHTAALVRQAKRNGTRILGISPGDDGSRALSDDFIRIRPGTDRFLAAAALRRLLEEDRVPENILSRARGGDSLVSALSRHRIADLAAACDVSGGDIDRVLTYYMDDGPTATLIGAGLQRYRYGGENVRFINALALLSGSVGISGGGIHFHQHSLGNLNYDWSRGPSIQARRALPMPVIGRSIVDAKDPPVNMLWISGSNVVNQAPDSHYTARVFRDVPFKVVVDAFLTDTAQRADLLLPTTLMLEQEDIVGSYLHNYVQYVAPVLDPPGEARSDFWILTELGKRLTPPIVLPDAEACLRASLEHPFLDTSLEELRLKKSIRAKRPPVAYEGLAFDHPDGKCRLPTKLNEEPGPTAQFPLRLLSLIRRDAMHSQIPPEDQVVPLDAWISPVSETLKHLNLERDVWIVSPAGRLRIRLQMMPGLHPEAVMVRRGSWMKLGGGINQLIGAELSDIGNGAPYYAQHVRLENVP